jgi:hypothetical protein
MKQLLQGFSLAVGLGLGAAAFAATTATTPTPPADAPAGTTGLCKDGSYTSGETKRGACKGHKGVKDWYVAADASKSETKAEKKAEKAEKSTAAAPAAAATSAAPAAAAASAAPAAAAAAPSKKSASNEPAKAPAPGGGPGLVWVNTSSKVYHCQGDKWYGTTKAGEYMSEADAKAKGNHAEHGKACS